MRERQLSCAFCLTDRLSSELFPSVRRLLEICCMKFLKGNPLVPCTGVKYLTETWCPEPGSLQQYVGILVTMSNGSCNGYRAKVGLVVGTAVPVLSGHSPCFIPECCSPPPVEGCWCRAVTGGVCWLGDWS